MAYSDTLFDVNHEPFDGTAKLPLNWYVDPMHLAREQEMIFQNLWHWVGCVDQLSQVGDYITCGVAQEPIIVVRCDDGELREFSNVCLHRASPAARNNGNAKYFRCFYHGWTYDLAGQLRATPQYERQQKDDSFLPQMGVETWGPFVFINRDPNSVSLSDSLGDLRDRFVEYRLEDLSFRRRVVLEADCNWKVLEENARECYHCFRVHPYFTVAYEVGNAITETFDPGSFLFVEQRNKTFPTKTEESAVALTRDIAAFRRRSPARRGLQGQEATGLYFVFPFPNFYLTLAPDHMSATRIVPVDVERMRLERDFFFEPDEGQEIVDDNIEFRIQNMKEDLEICESVQKGLHSRFHNPGCYAPKELAVHHFHGPLRRMLV
jgi:choline monooxygenase